MTDKDIAIYQWDSGNNQWELAVLSPPANSVLVFDGSKVASVALADFVANIAAQVLSTLTFTEEAGDPSAPAANRCVLYTKDNGGKTTLYARFNTGAVQSIAAEP